VTAWADSELAEVDEPPSDGAAHVWHDTKNNTANGTTWQPAAGSIAQDPSGVVGQSAAGGPGDTRS
jgi:hypothetical protein